MQLSHQPVLVQISFPVCTLGTKKPHRMQTSPSVATLKGPNLPAVLDILPPRTLCAARTLNPAFISQSSALFPLSSTGTSRRRSNLISSGKSLPLFSLKRCSSSRSSCLRRLWNRFLIPLSVLPGIILDIFAQ